MTMASALGHNLEAAIEAARPDKGFIRSHPINLTDWRLGTLLHLAAAANGIVGLGTAETGSVDIPAIIWDDTSDAGDNIIYPWQIPMDYNENSDWCKLFMKIRKFDVTGSASDNGDLQLTCDCKKFGPGDAAPAAISQLAVTLPALTQVNTWAGGFTTVEFDLSGNDIRAGGRLDFDIAPHQTVATNNQVELITSWIEYKSSLSYFDYAQRSRNTY